MKKTMILDHKQALQLLPDRDPWGHKGNYGRILLLCGSLGFTGAAALAARGALRAGAGLIFLGVPEAVYPIVATKLDEPVVFPLPARDGCLDATAIPEILVRLQSCDACLIGPGLGRTAGVQAVVSAVLSESQCPIILDADGINVLQTHMDVLRGRTCPLMLTPHDGEFLRLGGVLREDRLAAAAELAQSLRAVVLLKGHRTVITDGVNAYENRTGNPGMATGGSGDVLAGMITAFAGQRIPLLQAGACGAWFHGAAGDLCAGELGQYAMTPTDLLECLPRLLK